ncbi:hypothetical protein M441DRAFT_317151 [Trichoderma asperellum CBS 433.97]|uniref:Uncharacterized protein n=1 Tax=Trichoderma asperellum (strain ATCC 204424 / CBS 433.97 / NBRC 101777) TaxID=1042311 RepID=A0A2T3ZKV4_TRIA4|nr:hypothetical protein M441DRAFT_317151 [Trichoderma asperellum CBS 433.97]PTB45429.1 hypothetical protein M441DRAFT_317151 [Trichoderma asperellum CBS 433.97]
MALIHPSYQRRPKPISGLRRKETFAPYGAHLVGPEGTTPRYQTGPSPDSYSESGWTATRRGSPWKALQLAVKLPGRMDRGSPNGFAHGTLRCCWYGAQYAIADLVCKGATTGGVSATAAAESIRRASCACPGKLGLREESIERAENMRTGHSFPQPWAT